MKEGLWLHEMDFLMSGQGAASPSSSNQNKVQNVLFREGQHGNFEFRKFGN